MGLSALPEPKTTQPAELFILPRQARLVGRVIPHPAPACQQQSASEGFFWLVMGLGFAGAAIVFAARQMGLL